MSVVDQVAKNGAQNGAAVAANGAGGLSNLFTTLLVAQIKNQDPLSPQDPSQFVSQLAQLSQVEAMQKMASQGQTSAGMLASLQLMTLGAQVGSTLQARVEALQLDKSPLPLHFTLDSASPVNTLVLTGSDGSERRVELGSLGAGEQAYTLDPVKLGLGKGRYELRLETPDKRIVALEARTQLQGVRLAADGSVMLQLAGAGEVSSQSITQFKGRDAARS